MSHKRNATRYKIRKEYLKSQIREIIKAWEMYKNREVFDKHPTFQETVDLFNDKMVGEMNKLFN